MRAPKSRANKPIYEYTLMPTHMRARFSSGELQNIELSEPFQFTKGCKTMKIEAGSGFVNAYQYGTKLFDLSSDPGQLTEIEDLEVETKLLNQMVGLMKDNDVPLEQYKRLGLPEEEVTEGYLIKEKKALLAKVEETEWEFHMEKGVGNQLLTLMNFTEEEKRAELKKGILQFVQTFENRTLTKERFKKFLLSMPVKGDSQQMLLYFTELAGRTS